jgi:hypothetical protein
MPHRRTTENEFERRNGAFTLTMLSPSRVGLPYGSLPRLLVAWLTTEAVRSREREIVLGERLSEFMAKLDLVPTGGRWGTITRLRDQMQRLFASSVSCTYEDGNRWSMDSVRVADRADLWWSPKQPDQAASGSSRKPYSLRCRLTYGHSRRCVVRRWRSTFIAG